MERHPAATLSLVGSVFILAYGTSLLVLPKPNGQIVIGDALEHYVQLRSAVFDADLQFHNDYVGVYRLENSVPEPSKMTDTGHVRNYMPVGPALLWAPLFLLVAAGVWLLQAAGIVYPLDGFGRAFQASAGFSGIIAATLGSWFAFRAAALVVGPRAALWATLTIWLSSSAIYYSVISPAYSHAASMLAVSAFFWQWIRTRNAQSVGRYFVSGLLIGVAALMRWQDAILLAIPALDLLAGWRTFGLRAAAARLAASLAGALLAFVPQMVVWTILYGRPFTVPQGPGFMRWSEPQLLAVLFSDHHGLISWTPVVAVAIAGLGWLWRSSRLVCIAALVYLAISWYVNAAVADWWAGEAFGARRFVSAYPVFVLGLAAVFDRLSARPAWIGALASIFITSTTLLLIQYQAYMHRLVEHVPYPAGFDGLWLARFRVPFQLIASWLQRSSS
jgi:hypothetical protein